MPGDKLKLFGSWLGTCHLSLVTAFDVPSRASVMSEIHPTAVVSPGAELAAGVRIGPYAVVEDEVFIKEDCEIGAHPGSQRPT